MHIGIDILLANTGERVYQKNRKQLFTPASCMKIATAAAAIHTLGVDYRFETTLYTDGKIIEGTLRGNLYLKGSGDPYLNTWNLDDLAFQLKLLGIERVEGDLFVDNTDFDPVSQGPGWMWDEGLNYWNSPMDALTVNHSCVEIWENPAKCSPRLPIFFSSCLQRVYFGEPRSHNGRERRSLCGKGPCKKKGSGADQRRDLFQRSAAALFYSR